MAPRRCLSVVIAVAAFVGASEVAWGQGRSLASVSFEIVPKVSLVGMPPGQPVEIGMSTLRTALTVPYFIKSTKTVLLPGASYGLNMVSVDGVTEPPSRWHQVGLSLGLMQILSRRWRTLMMLRPSIAGDFKDIDGDHFRFSGVALGIVQIKPNLAFGFGLVANYQFGELLPLPGLMLRWEPLEGLLVDIFLPAFLRTSYTWAGRIEVGVELMMSGNRYTIRDNELVDNVRYTQVDGGGFLALRLVSLLWLKAYGGAGLYRRFDIYDKAGDAIRDFEFERGPVLRVGLEFRMPRRRRKK